MISSRCCPWSWSDDTASIRHSDADARRCSTGSPGAAVDDVVAARWLTAVGLPDADLRAAAVAAPDDADDLAAELLITLPDALVRVVGEVVELAVPLDTPPHHAQPHRRN